MRISKFRLAGLAFVLVGAAAKGAMANDLTVSTATTTPLTTSSPDGVSPGNITVNSTGSIKVGASQAAITINSNNTVANDGALSSEDAEHSRGVVLGNVTGSFVETGTISLLETNNSLVDSDSDGDIDGPYALGSDRIGVFLSSGNTFTGNVSLTSGTITVEGNNSAGVRLDGALVGNLFNGGSIGVVGDNSQGVAINGSVTGNVTLRGTINARGANASAILINAPITGALRVGGTVNVSGYHYTARPSAEAIAKLDADDLLQSGSALALHYGVTGGLVIEGIGVEDDQDDDGDTVTEDAGDTDDDLTANVSNYGSAPAVWIAPDAAAPTTLTLGATSSGYGFWNRGGITAAGIYDGVTATALRIEGVGAAGVNTSGGILNDGTITGTASEADAYAIYIGAGVQAPLLLNRKNIVSQSGSDTDKSAYGVYIAAGANVPTLRNTGVISAQLFGELGDGAAIVDRSNTLTLVENTGTVFGQVTATDSDTTDDVIPVATGTGIALDVSTSTHNFTYRQSADVAFTDDDSVDDDAAIRPPVRTVGAMLFGSGNDLLDVQAGYISGTVNFGAGADTFNLGNGTAFAGQINDSDGALTLNVADASLGLIGGHTTLTSAHFGNGSQLGILLDTDTSLSTLITASGSVTFDAGSQIIPAIPLGLPDSGSQVFLTANGGLIGASNVTGVVANSSAPFIYNVSITLAPGNSNSLQANYQLKSAQELGFNANEEAALVPILHALRTDNAAASAMTAIQDATAFRDAYADLLPDYSSSAAELATTAIDMTQRATSSRIAGTRLRDARQVSVWAQEIGYGVNRDPTTYGVEYRGYGFGFAFGIDGPLENGALFGLSGGFVASEVEEPGRKDGQISTTIGQFNAYLGTSSGPIDLDLIGGLGVGKMASKRYVSIGSSYEAISEAEWWSYEGHVAARASAPMALGSVLTLRPYVGATYVALSEEGYDETGGGTAVDLSVDSTTSQRLWADAGVELGARWRMRGGSTLSPHISLGYRANAIDEAAERTLRFSSTTDRFTLTDETTGSGGPTAGLGFEATNGYSTFSIQYEGEYGDQLTRHSLNAALRYRF